MRKHWLKLSMIAAAGLMAAAIAFAQGDIPTMAGVQNDSVVITPAGVLIVVDAAAGGLAGLTWSADGARLAYINRQGELKLTDAAGSFSSPWRLM
jgi:hypothetical protein